MRRGTKPPPDDIRALASVVVDALIEQRADAVVDDVRALLPPAIAEYLRLFPMVRNNHGRLWVARGEWAEREQHFHCFFCRESLNTLPWSKNIPGKMCRKFDEHGRLCAMRFLAGHIEGVGPNGEAPIRPKKPRAAPTQQCRACDGDGIFVVGGSCSYCAGSGRVAAV